MCLWEYGETTVGDLCRRLYLDNGTITPLIKRMEQEGYLTRSRSAEDERVVRVRLTERGWAVRDRAKDIPGHVGSCVRLSAEEAVSLRRVLYRLLTSEDGKDLQA